MKKEGNHNLHINELYFCHPKLTSHRAEKEIHDGLQLLNKITKPIVTIYGSHKVTENDMEFELCQRVAKKLALNNYAIATGGGSGIMLAANSTAKIFGTESIALRGNAFTDEHVNKHFYTHVYDYDFIFVRRFILCIKSDALIFFPGGYGTLNELMEILVLMQSKIIEGVPCILMHRPYWHKFFEWMREQLADRGMLTNDHDDLDIVSFAENEHDVIRIIKEQRKKKEYHSCDIYDTSNSHN